jgi:hypothetical protein
LRRTKEKGGAVRNKKVNNRARGKIISVDDEIYKLLASLAWKFSEKTGIDFEDLLSEAIKSYLRVLNFAKYNGSVKFTTYLYTACRNHLSSFVMLQRRQFPCCQFDDDIIKIPADIPSVERQYEFKEALENLSPLAKEIVELIFSNPVLFSGSSRKAAKKEIKKKALQRGYSIKDIKSAFSEIKTVVS